MAARASEGRGDRPQAHFQSLRNNSRASAVLGRLKGGFGLVLILACYLLLSITYSLVVPLFEAPDEPGHFQYVRFVATRHALPVEDRPGYPDYIQTAGHAPLYYILGALLTGWIETPDYPNGWPRNPYFAYGPDSLGANVFQHPLSEHFPFQETALAAHLLRALSIVIGAGTVIATWLLARAIFPLDEWLPLGAAAFVAFLPQFIFIDASMNNDNLVNMLSAAALIPIARIGEGKATRVRDFALLGIVVGLANLAKGSAIVLIPVAGVSILMGCRLLGWRSVLRNAIVSASTFLVVAGGWFVRNLIEFGDPLALNWRAVAYPDIVRTSPVTVQEIIGSGQAAWASFWAKFGWGNVNVDDWIYEVLAMATALALFGLLIRIAREWRNPAFPRRAFALLVLDTLGVGVVFIAFWYSYPVGGDQGRYMFTAIAPLAILFVWGLGGIFPSRWRGLASGLIGVGLVSLSAVIPFSTLIPAYQPFTPPPPITASQVPAAATRSALVFANEIRVYAFIIPPSGVTRGKTFSATFYWQAVTAPSQDDFVTVKLVADNGRVLDFRSRRPGGRRSPTNMWEAGEIVPDNFRLTVPVDAPSGEAKILVGFTPRGGAALVTPLGESEPALSTIRIN